MAAFCLDEPDGPLFVVIDGSQLIGFGGYEPSGFHHPGPLVFGLVRTDRHGQGIGHLLRHMARQKLRPRQGGPPL